VDVLARDTVAPAAMGKRDMQSKQAMGVDAYELMDQQLGHAKVKKAVGSINDDPTAAGAPPATMASSAVGSRRSMPVRTAVVDDQLVKKTTDAIASRFSNMRKAFEYVDLDRSGTLDEKELLRAIDMWNIPIDAATIQSLMAACDSNGDGRINYAEFVDALARDTVAPAAMGKRGMQSKEAMGVDAYELMDQQLGHGGVPKNTRYGEDPNDKVVDPELRKAGVHIPGLKAKDVREAHYTIISKFKERFSGIRKGFLALDDDSDGYISRGEFAKLLKAMNLDTSVRGATLDAVVQLIDVDSNDMFDYPEFQRFASANDVLAMDTARLKPRPKPLSHSNKGHGTFESTSDAMRLHGDAQTFGQGM